MASSKLQPIQGMSDIASPEIFIWQNVEQAARRILHAYNYQEVRTPVVEYTSVFTKSLGDTTDVVQKEMYTFEDRGGRSLTLRPEGTAGIIRYIAGLGNEAVGSRVYYIGPMFRCERPQAGRKRQFHQLGGEFISDPNPMADVESLLLQSKLFSAWGLNGISIDVNTRGLPEDRPAVAKGLTENLLPHKDQLCDDCQRRFEQNILRILDCKNPTCQSIVDSLPSVTTFMCDESRRYLDDVVQLVADMNMDVNINPRLVRGLDYYVHTVWEIKHDALGAQSTISGGGRYQIQMGNNTIKGVGFGIGLERLILALQETGQLSESLVEPVKVWLVALGEKALPANMKLMTELRDKGIPCGMKLDGGSMKSQMRTANRANAQYVIIRGDSELENNSLMLKTMADGTQEEMAVDAVFARI